MKIDDTIRKPAAAPAADELERELADDALYGSSGYFVKTDVRVGPMLGVPDEYGKNSPY